MNEPNAHSRSVVSALFLCAVLVIAAGAAALVPEPDAAERNFDARVDFNRSFALAPSALQHESLQSLAASVEELAVTFDDRFGTVHTLSSHTGYLTSGRQASREPLETALRFVRANLAALGLEAGDLAGLEVTDLVESAVSGATHIYLRQRHAGLPVYNAQLHVNVNRDGRIISVNNAFVPGLARAAVAGRETLGAGAAVASAERHLGIVLRSAPAQLGAASDEGMVRIEGRGVSKEVIEARKMWLPVRAGMVRLVWSFQVQTLDDQHWYDMTVDAETGAVWTRFDWVSPGSYRVYDQPTQSPIHTTPLPPADARVLVVNPENSTASPSGWFSGGVMSGNNVHACIDANANNVCDTPEPSCSGTTCDFAIDLSSAPSNSRPAAVANLFYWNNVIHDVQYQYGFDEVGGNFQENNFGRGGAGSDSVNADAQDGSGNCNANFGTPSDGGNPRMQMFLCNRATPSRDGDFDAGVIVHEYGHGISNRQVGGPAASSCLGNAQQAGEGWSDFFGLVYTAKPGDLGTDARGIGAYLFNLAASGGTIRDLPYSTDPAVNNWTYESIRGAVIPHGVGSRWAQVAWKAYWALVDKWGFEADLLSFDINDPNEAGNKRALFYVNEGLKNTACSPTFVANRDGIIQAATDNFGGADVCTLWQVFADFGLGTNAVSGGSGSTNPTNGFNLPTACDSTPPPPPPPPPTCAAGSIDFNALALTSYADQNVTNGMTVADAGATLVLTGNTWKRSTQSFTITPSTVLEFQFASSVQGEIHAIGFDNDNTLNNDPRHFNFWGTQNWTGGGRIDWTPKYSGGGAFQAYSIPVGQFYTGSMSIVFTNDQDAGTLTNEGRFRCVRVFEDTGNPPPGGCTVNDDFETSGAAGWSNDAASTCTTGAYVLGNPTNPGGGVQIVGSSSGTSSLFTAVNTSAGADDVDGGNCILASPAWSVANASTLSVAYWHGQRDNADDPSGDFFRLEFSTNGGSTWSTLASHGDTPSTATWTTATAPIAAGSNVRLRVQCSDGAGPGDLVECGIDDVSICE